MELPPAVMAHRFYGPRVDPRLPPPYIFFEFKYHLGNIHVKNHVVAEVVRHGIGSGEVAGSNPSTSTIKFWPTAMRERGRLWACHVSWPHWPNATWKKSEPDTCHPFIGPPMGIFWEYFLEYTFCWLDYTDSYSSSLSSLHKISMFNKANRSFFQEHTETIFLWNEVCQIQNDKHYTVIQVPSQSKNFYFLA